MKDNPIIFIAADPRGYTVTFTQSQREHIDRKRTDVSNEAIERSIVTPNAIYKSTEPSREVYFKQDKKSGKFPLFTKTVVNIDDEEKKEASVVTCFYTQHIDGKIEGEEGGLLYADIRL